MAKRGVFYRYRIVAWGNPGGAWILWSGLRHRTPWQQDLRSGRFQMDAERRPDASVPRLEARVRVSKEPVGPLRRGIDPVLTRYRVSDASDFSSLVVRLEARSHY